MDQPQEFGIFYNQSKAKSITSAMGLIFVQI